jgi:pimeloyl-ACP methyl ester carboxylesterase
MPRMSRPERCGGLAAALAVALLPAPGPAQAPPEKVRFDTVDEVELHGFYHPSAKAEKAPCVLLLHNLGGNCNQPGWDDLARQLQLRGFAVLRFDFRGHGASTAVSPAFWKVDASKILKGAKAKGNQIGFKEFGPNYLPMLINDVAAARRFLDAQNDSKMCNTSNLFVVGAGEGATVGALWVASEWVRNDPRVAGGAGGQQPVGADLAGAVWLSISPSLGGKPANIEKWLGALRGKRRAPPAMGFLYGEADDRSADLAKRLVDDVLRADTPPRLKNTLARGFKTKAAGHELLAQKNLDIADKVVNFLETVLEARDEAPWVNRNTRKAWFDFAPVPPGLK